MNTKPLRFEFTPAIPLGLLRWTARVWSLLTIGVILMFAIGEGLNLARFTPRELVLFLFFPLGLCLGLIVAWRWEGWGGGITVGSLAAFYLANRLMSARFPGGVALLALAGPGFLFPLCRGWTHWLHRRQKI